jgi:diacylglycerol kinase family enzyme/membrane-associated phospholipid phosphatase
VRSERWWLSKKLDRADRRMMRRLAALPDSPADDALKGLGRAANHSALWLVTAAVLASRRGQGRRAGLRGVAAIAGASFLASLVTKRLVPRRRPAAELVPCRRRLSPSPTSSSFPSGHAASAAAFTTAVALEQPAVAAAVAPVAAAVAYSRVHTGVHWPSDVFAGAALGCGVGLATRRWWPVRPERPSLARPCERVATLVDGEGLLLLVNPASGDADDDPTARLKELWPAATIAYGHPEGDLLEQFDDLVRAQRDRISALGVAGGDGTVAAAAGVAARHGLPLAAVPAGTLNHFCGDLGVLDADDVARAVAEGTAVQMGVGSVAVDGGSERLFVNTASIGGYPEMVRLRQQWEPRWGKWPAAAAALIRTLGHSRPLRVRLNGQAHRVWWLFVGNSGYQPKGFAPTWRPRLDDGVLDIRYARADVAFSRARFVLATLSGALFNSRTYVQHEQQRMDVEIMDGHPAALACDGEVSADGRRFTFAALDTALRVYRPTDPAEPA